MTFTGTESKLLSFSLSVHYTYFFSLCLVLPVTGLKRFQQWMSQKWGRKEWWCLYRILLTSLVQRTSEMKPYSTFFHPLLFHLFSLSLSLSHCLSPTLIIFLHLSLSLIVSLPLLLFSSSLSPHHSPSLIFIAHHSFSFDSVRSLLSMEKTIQVFTREESPGWMQVNCFQGWRRTNILSLLVSLSLSSFLYWANGEDVQHYASK